ncbi:hypothetical protein CPB83DRAFT_849651 [Crepidotus variabilis]|uniref:Uncharacterized protein n=1 Tax=Crepidotus variabilis TaxID=179855 RepID=A0A9P6JT67_9AGAR|nr:hypothetical protein CPB83DRAFT_849651 [Crepidotus variabilis]
MATRAVIWSYPLFWNSLVIIITQNRPLLYMSLVEECIARSGETSLVIRVCFKKERSGEILQKDAIVRLTNPLQSFSTPLRIDGPFSSLPYHIHTRRIYEYCPTKHLVYKASLSKKIRFEDDLESGAFDLGADGSPSLLVIDCFQPQNVLINWSNVTHFLGSSWTKPQCINIIQDVPRLLKCTFENVHVDGEAFPAPQTCVIHSSIKYLRIEDNEGLFECLTISFLEELSCDLSGDSFNYVLSDFIIRSQCQLDVGTFSGSSEDDDDLIEFLRLTSSLRKLELMTNIGETFINHLAATSTFSININPHPFFQIFKHSFTLRNVISTGLP